MVGELKEVGAGVWSARITWKVKPYLEGKWENTHRQKEVTWEAFLMNGAMF